MVASALEKLIKSTIQ